MYKNERHASRAVVEADAEDLSRRIGALLQQYANESQRLDQTFPKRIISAPTGSALEEMEIRNKLSVLNQKRDSLVEVGLISSAISDPISPGDIISEEGIRRILEIYINDTDSKLSIFDDLYKKINLFKKIIDEHFSYKELVINSEEGLLVIDSEKGVGIPIKSLSSGEQHELVLIYALLFKVKSNSLILIDEPELSLHVAWQKRFISDIQQIQVLRDMNVIIATHSPQIINDKWDYVQDLSC